MNAFHLSAALIVVLVVSHTSFAGCPGCPQEADVNSPEVQKHVNKSIEAIQQKTNSPYKLQLVKIESVTTQVVEGQLLKYKLIVGYEDPNTKKQVNQRCTVEVWTKSWQKFEQTTVKECENITE